MGEFSAYICTNKLANQCLQENMEIQLSLDKIAKTASNGDGQDNHHTGANSLQQRYAKNNQQCQLDKGSSADAKGTRSETVNCAS